MVPELDHTYQGFSLSCVTEYRNWEEATPKISIFKALENRLFSQFAVAFVLCRVVVCVIEAGQFNKDSRSLSSIRVYEQGFRVLTSIFTRPSIVKLLQNKLCLVIYITKSILQVRPGPWDCASPLFWKLVVQLLQISSKMKHAVNQWQYVTGFWVGKL